MKHIQTFEEFLSESLANSEYKKGSILVHDKTGEEVEFVSAISPIKISVKDSKGKNLIVSPMYYTVKR